MKKIAEVVATVFYVGYVPVVPATFGAGFGVLAYWFLVPRSVGVELVVMLALIPVAILTSGKAEEGYGRDARCIVVDEVAGMFVSLYLLPRDPLVFLVAFFAFRVFDVLKPFPSGRLQKLRGGWGVVADDVFAGLYANVFIRLLLLLR